MVSTKIIVTSFSLNLTFDNFAFNCTHYLQIMGCAMVTVCTPSYANIFMTNLKQNTSILTLQGCLCYGSLHKSQVNDSCINELNEKKNNKTIKFDFQFSPRKTVFLATMLYREENNNSQITLYCTPIDEQAFLLAKSVNQNPLKNSILYSQALRLKTICSTTTEYNKNCAIIKQKFLDRKELFTNKENHNKN